MQRLSGILLHPTSLPSPYGIGDLGAGAYAFVDWLAQAGQRLWQVLPIGPTGYGDSPYASFSTFAGNPLLIGFDDLLHDGLINKQELDDHPANSPIAVDYGAIIPWKMKKLTLASERFLSLKNLDAQRQLRIFIDAESWWLEEYVLFMDIKEHFDAQAMAEDRHGAMWSNYWPADLALHHPSAIEAWRADEFHQKSMQIRRVIQYFFFKQWRALKEYANQRSIAVIGDLPIFVAPDSVDVWSDRSLFQLDPAGVPLYVAGVPPDYFSKTGQLWGNPLYDWEAHERTGFAWWIRRIKGSLRFFDWLRVDHFRGFEAYWSVPFGEPNAINGTWEKAPGHRFFDRLGKELGALPILAEDLGFITEEVRDLRDSFHLPGMKILQFAFDAAESGKGLDTENGFLPHMYTSAGVVYTGTHDNDTLRGWLDKAKSNELAFIQSYLGYEPENIVQALIRLAFSSVAQFAVVPMQDVLGLGSEARMNTPSTLGNNWKWRVKPTAFSTADAQRLKEWSYLYARNR